MSDGVVGATSSPARIEALRVQNYRVLRDLQLRNITPLSVLLGPNGSGKSTSFDVFAFLSPSSQSASPRTFAGRGTGATASESFAAEARRAPS